MPPAEHSRGISACVFVLRVIVLDYIYVRVCYMYVFMCKKRCLSVWEDEAVAYLHVSLCVGYVSLCVCVSGSVCMYVYAHVQPCLIKACVLLLLSHTGQMEP